MDGEKYGKVLNMYLHPHYHLYLQRIPDNHPVKKFDYVIDNGRVYTKEKLTKGTFLDLRHLDFNYVVRMFRNPCHHDIDVGKDNNSCYEALKVYRDSYYSPTNLSKLNISSCSIRVNGVLYGNPKVIKDILPGEELLQLLFFEDSFSIATNSIKSSNALGYYRFLRDHDKTFDYVDGLLNVMNELKRYLDDIGWNGQDDWKFDENDLTYVEWKVLG